MKLTYVAYSRLDLQSANSIQTFNTCRALSTSLGDQLTAIVPRFRGLEASPSFGVVRIPRVPLNKITRLHKSVIWSYLERTVFAVLASLYLRLHRADVVYVRDVICAYWLIASGNPVIYEVHDLESRHPSQIKSPRLSRWMRGIDERALRGARALVSLTRAFRDQVLAANWQPADRVFVIPDAYDDSVYYPRSQGEMRARLGLAEDVLLVAYAGMTFAYRRLDLLLEALSKWGEPRARALIVGGRPFEVEELRKRANGLGLDSVITWRPRERPEATAADLAAADILVIPETVTDATASPLKMFEYMALGKAIIAVDRPALREILVPGTAQFFASGDAEDFARALRTVGESEELRRSMSSHAVECVRDYTYSRRAEAIMNVCQQFLGAGAK